MEKNLLDKQSLIARKYTIMMNNEPLDLWIKGDRVTKATFMDRKADLSLSVDTVRHIKSMPTRLVNGENLKNKEDFVRKTSALMSAQLELAIARQDMKVLSRFAQSKLVPDAQKEDFLEAINRPNGLRGALTKGLNHAQQMFRNMAQRIDRFFDRTKDTIANEKLDQYLKEFQHHEFNKAPKFSDLNLEQFVDPKLQERAFDFVKQNGTACLSEDTLEAKTKQEEFLRAASRDGHSAADAKLALGHVRDKELAKSVEEGRALDQKSLTSHEAEINRLNAMLAPFLLEQAKRDNKTEADLERIMLDMQSNGQDLTNLVPFVLENEAYKAASPEEKWNIENRVLYCVEPLPERALEVREIQKVLEAKSPELTQKETQVERGHMPTQDPAIMPATLNSAFKELREATKPENKPTPEVFNQFHSVAAIKFDGIDINALKAWERNALKRGVTPERTQDFIQRSLNHGHVLTNMGLMQKTAEGVYKFKDPAAKACLWENRNKPLEQLATLNAQQATRRTQTTTPQQELMERVKVLASAQSFENLLDKQGNIEPQKLKEYAHTLERVSLQLREVANRPTITREDLQAAKAHWQAQSHEQARA